MLIKLVMRSLLFCLLLGVAPLMAQEEFPHVDGDVLIRLKPNHTLNWVLGDLAVHKGLSTRLQVTRVLSKHMRIWQLHFNSDAIPHNTMLDRLRKHPAVEDAQLNYILEKRVVPNDAKYGQQWQYEQATDVDLDAEAAWDITTGGVTALGDTIVVCVIDDALDVNHPDMNPNVWRNNAEIPNNGVDDDGNGYVDDFQGWNANNNNNNILPGGGFSSHGTPVAGIVGAKGNNGIGVTGVSWDVKVMFVVGGGTSANSIAAYNYPFECRKLYNQTDGARGAFVVATNASWGVDRQQCATYAPLVNSFYDTLGAYGILNAAATANANNDVDVVGDFPTSCNSDYLVAVTNMNQQGNKVGQAGFGTTTVDLGAFGEGTYTIAINNNYGGFGGTSGATPHVAGAIGLLYSAPCPKFAVLARTQPAQTALYIKQILLNSTVPNTTLQGITVSGGVLNLKNALDSLLNTDCSLSGCHKPYLSTLSNITGTSAQLTWETIDSTSSYYVQYRIANDTVWTDTTVSDTSIVFSTLIPCTEYEVRVAAGCDSTVYSTPIPFRTGDCCFAPSIINIDSIYLTGANLSWTGDPFVTNYIIEYKLLSDTIWQTITSTQASLDLNILDSCSLYEIRIQSNCPVNVNNNYSPTITLRTNGCGNCTSSNYCTSSGQTSTDDWLDSVVVADLNNFTGNDGGYASFVSSGPSTTLMQGGSYPITVALGYNLGSWQTNWRIKVWIDFNQDEQFDDLTETVYDAGQISTATAVHNGTITVPVSANLGNTRMRVAIKWGTTPLGPCDASTYGETEDYCVIIEQSTDAEPVLELPNTTLLVYPNPFDRQLTLAIGSKEMQEATIMLQTITGQEIMHFSRQLDVGDQTIQLPGQQLSPGVYLIQVQLENGEVLTRKVIRE